MNIKDFIQKFPFSKESREYIGNIYKLDLRDLDEKYSKQLKFAFRNLKENLIVKKGISYLPEMDNALIYAIMQILIRATQSYLLYEHFSEAHRKNVIRIINGLSSDDKDFAILTLSKNTFEMNLQAGEYDLIKKRYIFIENGKEVGKKLKWRIFWRDYLIPMSEIASTSSSAKGTQWALSKQIFEKGWVYLSGISIIKFMGYITKRYIKSKYIPYLERGFAEERLLAERQKDAIKNDLLTIDYIKKYVTKLQEDLSDISHGFSKEREITDLKIHYYPPCIRYIIKRAFSGINLDHNSRLVLVFFLAYIKVDIESIINIFRTQPDFIESKTRYYVENVVKKEYFPYGCDKIRAYNLCKSDEDKMRWCPKGEIKNPLIYYDRMVWYFNKYPEVEEVRRKEIEESM